MSITLKTDDGALELRAEADTVRDLNNLGSLTRRPVPELFAEAVESLRQQIIRQPAGNGRGNGKGAK